MTASNMKTLTPCLTKFWKPLRRISTEENSNNKQQLYRKDMAKIQITESELKQVIQESVVKILNEGNFGMSWDQLTPDEQEKFTDRYHFWNPKNFFKSKKNIDPAEVEQRYQEIQARKQRNGNARFSQEQGQRLQRQVAALTKSAQMADISFQDIEKTLDSLIAATQPQQKPLEEVKNDVYTDVSTTDAQGNTNTTRTYNDNYNFKERGNNIATKIEMLKNSIKVMKRKYDKEIIKWKDLYNTKNQENASLQQRIKNGNLPAPSKPISIPTGKAVAQNQGGLAPRLNTAPTMTPGNALAQNQGGLAPRSSDARA